jgi:hypothetical protein
VPVFSGIVLAEMNSFKELGMRKRKIIHLQAGVVLFVAALLASVSCDTATSCLDQQKRGPVTSGSGHVNAVEGDSVLVPYDNQGTQNDAQFTWTDKGRVGGPLLQVYATSADCRNLIPK